MAQANRIGPNRTGMDMSPITGKAMVEDAEKPPGTMEGALSVGGEKLQRHHPGLLITRLGQRLAFERAGTRLYEALIRKCEAGMDPATAGIVSVETLQQFRNEEREHALLVASVLEGMGANPGAMTPDADVSALASLGLARAITEPGTNLLQCLEALQMAEFADNAAWEKLQALCNSMGLKDIAARLDHPIAQEQNHQRVLTQWIQKLVRVKGEDY